MKKLFALLLVLCMFITAFAEGESSLYQKAKSLYDEGFYLEAAEIYKSLGNYEKSELMFTQSMYRQAISLMKNEKYQDALSIFQTMPKYKDSQRYLNRCNIYVLRETYNKACQLMEAGQYKEAHEIYKSLGGYSDSRKMAKAARIGIQKQKQEQAELCLYNSGIELMNQGKLEQAREFFINAGPCDGATEALYAVNKQIAQNKYYARAEKYLQEKDYAKASNIYEFLGDFKDSKEKLASINIDVDNQEKTLQKALYLCDIWEIDEANALLTQLGEYGDANIILTGNRYFSTEELRNYRRSACSPIYTAQDGSKHVYRIYKGVQLWQEARRFCEALGGHLATISDAEENAFIHDFMIDCGYTEAYFGLSDEHRTGDWVWVTGEKLTFTNWGGKEPSRCLKERYGMFFTTILKPRTWNDSHFYEHAKNDPGCSFICEWDLED